jgi:branched-chain amino acid transport system substrate-binding protein
MFSALRLILLSLLLCSGTVAHAEALRIAVTISMSGKYAELGSMNEKAYRLWEQDTNRKGGLLGRPVKVLIADDKSDPQVAKELYRKFIVEDRVDLVLGPYSSDITRAVADVTEQYRYPLLASGASADSLWREGRKYLFGVYVTSSNYTTGFLELLVRAGLTKVALLSADDLFSRDIAVGTREWAKRYQLNIVFSDTFEKSSPAIEKSIRSARDAGAEALIVTGHFDDAINGRIALGAIGWTPQAYYATVGPAIQRYSDTLKSEADYTYSSSQWEPSLGFPGTREFTESFKKAYGMTPSYHAASAYAAGQIIEAAIRKAKTADRAKLRDALSTLDTITVLGRYGVDRDGRQVRHFTTTVQWQKGRKDIIGPEKLKTAAPAWR